MSERARAFKRFRRWATILAIFAVGIPVSAAVLIRSARAHDRLRTLATDAIRRELGLRATLGRVQIELFPFAITARDIALDDPLYGRVADAELLRIQPSVHALVRGSVDIASIELEGANVHLVIEDGQLRNVPRIETGGDGGPPTLPFHELAVRRASFSVDIRSTAPLGPPDVTPRGDTPEGDTPPTPDGPRTVLTARLEDVEVHVRGEDDHVIDVVVRAGGGQIEHQHGVEEVRSIDAHVELGVGSLVVPILSVEAGPLRVALRQAHMPLPPPSDPDALAGIAGEVELDYDLSHLMTLPLPITLPQLRGVVRLRAHVTEDESAERPSQRERAVGTLVLEGGGVNEFDIGETATLTFDATRDGVEITGGEVLVVGDGGRIELTGSIGLRDELPVTAHARLTGLSFARLMETFGVTRNSIVEWIFEGDMRLAGSLRDFALEGPVDLRTHDFVVSQDAYHERPIRSVISIPRGHFVGRWSIRDDAVRFSGLTADLPRSRIFGDVVLGFRNELRVDVRADADVRDASPLAGFLMEGIGQAACHIDGTFQAPRVTGHLTLRDFSFDGIRLGDVDSDAILDMDGMGVTFPEIRARKRDSTYAARDLYLDFHHDRFELTGSLALDRMTLADFYHAFGFEEDERFEPYQGIARGTATLHYTHDFPGDSPSGTLTTDLDLQLTTATLNGYAFDGGEIVGRWHWLDWSEGYRGGELSIDHAALRKGDGVISLSGRMSRGGALRMFAVADRLSMRDIEGIGDRLEGLEGIATATADVGGTAELMRVDLDVGLTNVMWQGRPLGDGRAYARMTHQGDPWVRDALTWERGQAPSDEPCAAARWGLAHADWPADPPMRTSEGLQQRMSVPGAFLICGSAMDGRLLVDLAIGRTSESPMRGSIRVDGLEIASLLPLSSEDAELADAVGGTHARVSGTLAFEDGGLMTPERLDGALELTELVITRGDLELGTRGPVRVRIDDGVATVERARFRAPGSSMRVEGQASLDDGLALRLIGDVDLGLAPRLSSSVSDADGRVHLDVAVSGPIASPEYYGEATLEGGTVRMAALAGPIEDLDAHVVLSARSVLLDRLSARLYGGQLDASGEAMLEGRTLSRYAFDVRATDIALSPAEGLDVALGADARLAWERGDPLPNVSGVIHVERLEYTHDIAVGTSLGELTAASRTEVSTYDPALDRVRLDLRVVHEAPFVLRNNLVDAQLSITDDERPFRLVGTDQRYGVVGDMAFTRGRIFFRNAAFDLGRGGSIAFDDETRVDPHFDVRAQTDVRRSRADIAAPSWRIDLHAFGSRDSFQLVTSSEPDLPQEDILLLLTVGMTRSELEQLRAGDLGSTAALETLASVTGLDREVRRALPVVDDFQVSSTYSPRTGRTEPAISVGKRIADRVRLSATTTLSEDRRFRATLEGQLDDTTSVQLGYDTFNLTGTGTSFNIGVDVIWRLEFE